jgi:hypothetical protein
MNVIFFSPPMQGIEGTFNTFRIGLRYSKLLKRGDKVLLVDLKGCVVIGHAKVKSVIVGRLDEMAKLYAHENHNQTGLDGEGASDRLVANMQKRYGPHIASLEKKTTVIYLTLLKG